MKRFADFRCGDGPTLKVGDKVYVDASDYTTDRPSKKLSNKRIGPYLILEVINDNAFKLTAFPKILVTRQKKKKSNV